MVASVFRQRGAAPLDVEDFLPFPPPPREMTVEETAEYLKRLTIVWGGTIKAE